MDHKELMQFYERLKDGGLSQQAEENIRREIGGPTQHYMPARPIEDRIRDMLHSDDTMFRIQGMTPTRKDPDMALRTLDDLLKRDEQRKRDGFPKKVRVGKIIKPSRGGKKNIIVVPVTEEEKFYHTDETYDEDGEGEGDEEGGESGGTGEGEEGEVLHEQPLYESEDGEGQGAGQGEGGEHEMESNAYEIGRLLTEKLELPNIQDKGKKKAIKKYIYDLTDRNRGSGQLLDKKASLKRIIRTNRALGRIDKGQVDPKRLLINPRDKVYRVLSEEKDFESQAVVFFMRDYSGSMQGPPTDMVVQQHLLIYSWLVYQYEELVESRFVVHDTEAKEVPDFYTYYNIRTAGGTQIASGYELINEIVRTERLAKDYNIYVFHGTDGDDWDSSGEEALPEIAEMLTYVNRLGITKVDNLWGSAGNDSSFETYLKGSGLLEANPELIRLEKLGLDDDDEQIIAGIRNLVS